MGKPIKAAAGFAAFFFLAAPASANAGVTLSLGIGAMAATTAVTLLLFLWAGAGQPIGRRAGIIGLELLFLAMVVYLSFYPVGVFGMLLLLLVTLQAIGVGVYLIGCGWGWRKAEEKRAMAAGVMTIAAAIGLGSLGTSGFEMGSRVLDLSNLGGIRSALSVYYGDMEGQFPADLDALTIGGKYLKQIPSARVAVWSRRLGLTFSHSPHGDSALIRYGKVPDDSGGWLYNNTLGDLQMGTIVVNCTHTDWKGSMWTAY